MAVKSDPGAVAVALRRAGLGDELTVAVGEMSVRSKKRGIHLKIGRSKDPNTGQERCFTFDLDFTI